MSCPSLPSSWLFYSPLGRWLATKTGEHRRDCGAQCCDSLPPTPRYGGCERVRGKIFQPDGKARRPTTAWAMRWSNAPSKICLRTRLRRIWRAALITTIFLCNCLQSMWRRITTWASPSTMYHPALLFPLVSILPEGSPFRRSRGKFSRHHREFRVFYFRGNLCFQYASALGKNSRPPGSGPAPCRCSLHARPCPAQAFPSCTFFIISCESLLLTG